MLKDIKMAVFKELISETWEFNEGYYFKRILQFSC